MVRSSTDLTRNLAFVGMRKLVPFLWFSDRVLLDAADKLGTLALRILDLMKCLDGVQLLEELNAVLFQVLKKNLR